MATSEGVFRRAVLAEEPLLSDRSHGLVVSFVKEYSRRDGWVAREGGTAGLLYIGIRFLEADFQDR
jgi:hypothetical protein